MVVLVWQWDLMNLEVFSNLSDSMILLKSYSRWSENSPLPFSVYIQSAILLLFLLLEALWWSIFWLSGVVISRICIFFDCRLVLSWWKPVYVPTLKYWEKWEKCNSWEWVVKLAVLTSWKWKHNVVHNSLINFIITLSQFLLDVFIGLGITFWDYVKKVMVFSYSHSRCKI